MDRPQTESDGEIGTGFSVEIARAWEDALFEGYLPGTRRVALRFSWIHLDDVLGILDLLEATPALEGPVNLSSPHPVDNAELMRTVRDALGVRVGVPIPRWMLELGALGMRTETELILKSRWVLPERLLDAGYEFRRPLLAEAVAASFAAEDAAVPSAHP